MYSALWSAKLSIKCGPNNFLLYQQPPLSPAPSPTAQDQRKLTCSIFQLNCCFLLVPESFCLIPNTVSLKKKKKKEVSTLEIVYRVRLANNLWAWVKGSIYRSIIFTAIWELISVAATSCQEQSSYWRRLEEMYNITISYWHEPVCTLSSTLLCVEMSGTELVDGFIAICRVWMLWGV